LVVFTMDPRRPVRLWTLDLGAVPALDVQPRIAATCARTGREDAQAISQAMGLRDCAEVLQRLAAGRRCYVARVGSAIAAYGWVTFDREWIGEIRERIVLQPGEAYVGNCGTLVAYRRQRLFSGLLGYIVSELRSEGLHRAWIGAVCDDPISPRGIAVVGFRPVAELRIAWALGIRLTWVCGLPGAPRHLVEGVRRAVLGDRGRTWVTAVTTQSAYLGE
jgi:hypothetical protein